MFVAPFELIAEKEQRKWSAQAKSLSSSTVFSPGKLMARRVFANFKMSGNVGLFPADSRSSKIELGQVRTVSVRRLRSRSVGASTACSKDDFRLAGRD